MKKLVLFLLPLSLQLPLIAQSDLDMLRYAQTNINGDARFIAMGGSFGALGANSSCMNFNPAGIGLFRKGEISMNLGFRGTTASSNHYNYEKSDFKFTPMLGYFAWCLSKESKNPYTTESSKKKFPDYSRRHTFGLSINKTANFNSNVNIEGYVKNKSIVDDFLNYAQGYTPENLNYFYEGMAFNTYLIDTLPGSISQYGTYYNRNGTYKQSKQIASQGGISELSFAYAFAIDNKYYLGASLGIPSIRYENNSILTESDSSNSVENFNQLYLEELLQTRGIGINLKLGGIARINSNLRIGAYFHSPTKIRLNDTYESYLEVKYDSLFGYTNLILSDSSGQGEFTYSITTPMRYGASVGVLFNKFLAFNIDAEFINYAQGYLKSEPDYFQSINKEIRKKYKNVSNLRLGTEINLNPFLIRFGFATYGSPFGNILNGKFIRNAYSTGLGYRPEGKWYFDAALVHSRQAEEYFLYNPELIQASTIAHKSTQLILTAGFRF